jgi:hypothetical protein
MSDHTIGRAALVFDARVHNLDFKRAARARHQAGMRGRETHVRIIGRIQVLRSAASHRGEKVGAAIVADCGMKQTSAAGREKRKKFKAGLEKCGMIRPWDSTDPSY